MRVRGVALMAALDQLQLTAQVVEGLRDGDVLWIQLDPEAKPEEMEAVRTVVRSHLAPDATVLVSPVGFPAGVSRLALSELLRMRDVLDDAIRTYTAANLVDVEV